MSKTRTILRYCLVTLLLCCAGVTVYLWPYRPVLLVNRDFQKMEMEGIVRLDEQQKRLITNYWKLEKSVTNHFHSYDTISGVSTTINKENPLKVSIFPFDSHYRFSSNGTWVTTFYRNANTLDIIDTSTGQSIKSIQMSELSFTPDQLDAGFSHNCKYLWHRVGRSVFVYETTTFSLLHELSIRPQFITLEPKIIYLSAGIDIDISDDGKLLTIADKNLDVVGLVDLTTKQQHTIPNANMANILADQRTVLAFKMDEHGVIATQPIYYCLGTTSQLETVAHARSDSCVGHFLCMNDRFLVTFQKTASVARSPFYWKWVPDNYRAKLADTLGLLQVKVPFTVWSTENGEATNRFTLSLPGTMEKNGWQSFNRVNAHADVISSDGTLLGLSDTASLSLWNIPPRRHWSCWVMTGGFTMLALWCGWPRRGKVATKPLP